MLAKEKTFRECTNLKSTVRLLLPILLLAQTAFAEITDSKFVSEDEGLEVKFPKRWQGIRSHSYPHVLVILLHEKRRGKMVVTRESPLKKITLNQYIKKTQSQLKELGYKVQGVQTHGPSGALWFDSRDKTNRYLRTAILLRKKTNTFVSVTLSTQRSEAFRIFLRDFDTVLRGIKIQ